MKVEVLIDKAEECVVSLLAPIGSTRPQRPERRSLQETMTGPSTATAATSNPPNHASDHVSGEQYRYALTNFVRTSVKDVVPLTAHLIPHMDSLRPSLIKRSRNSGHSSRSRSGRSHGCRHALQRSRARPITHPSPRASVLQAEAPSMIFPSRCVLLSWH